MWCAGLSLRWPLLLRSTGSRCLGFSSCGSRALECSLNNCGAQLSCSAARGIFPDQGLNPCPRHWQADSSPLGHQGSPVDRFLICGWLNPRMWNLLIWRTTYTVPSYIRDLSIRRFWYPRESWNQCLWVLTDHCIYPKRLKTYVHTKTCLWMFIAALFIIAKT